MKNNEDVLNLVFKKNENIEYKVNDSGIVIIQEKQDHKIQRVFRKLRFKIPMYKNIELDECGSFIFLQVDGNKNVKELGEILESKYGEESHPLYERLLLFLNHIEVNCHYIEKVQ